MTTTSSFVSTRATFVSIPRTAFVLIAASRVVPFLSPLWRRAKWPTIYSSNCGLHGPANLVCTRAFPQLAQRLERRTHLATKKFRLLPRSEVPAFREPVVVNQFGISFL